MVRTTLILSTLSTINAWSQETEPTPAIVTDRADVTESSMVVPKGSLQFENGMAWTTGHGNQSIDFSETLVRFGISTRMEFRVVGSSALTLALANPAISELIAPARRQLAPQNKLLRWLNPRWPNICLGPENRLPRLGGPS